jgi:hypothetical protein
MITKGLEKHSSKFTLAFPFTLEESTDSSVWFVHEFAPTTFGSLICPEQLFGFVVLVGGVNNV